MVEALTDDVLRDAATVDVFTFHAAHEILPERLSRRIVKESRLARLPGIRQVGHDPGRWRYLLPYMPHFFRSLPLGDYDLVIASSHSCAINAAPPPGVPYVCYSHTPMRYAWLPDAERERLSGIGGKALRLASGWLRAQDLRASKRPDRFIANSSAVRARIRRFYGREAEVIHPPVEIADLGPSPRKEPGPFLWVNRLVRYKRPELVVDAFRGLPHQLVMVGIGPMEPALRARLPDNVRLHGWLPRAELCELYANASGFLHPAEEDFGMTMVEALASGTPVIALDAGGARDIVRDGTDGLLLQEATVASIRDAVDQVASRDWDSSVLVRRSHMFAPDRFHAEMRRTLASAMR